MRLHQSADAIVQAVVSNQRPTADLTRDHNRKPAQVLAFFGIERGMRVLDLYSGGGYYTEILAAVVGPEGSVVAHNNRAYLTFAEPELTQRFAPGRLANVERLTAENNQLQLAPGEFDAVLMILTYHDVYFVDEENGWSAIDAEQLRTEIFRSMRSSAVLGIVDHVASVDAPLTVAQNLHRIDPLRIRRELEATGFVFEGESKVLHNAFDDHSEPMFSEGLRGKTDRAVLKFRKP